MIGITISGRAYAAIAAATLAGAPDREIVSEGQYLIWQPQAVVVQLMALREPGETFSEVILRLADQGSIAGIVQEKRSF